MSTRNRVTTDGEQFANHNRRQDRPTLESVSRERYIDVETDSGEYDHVPAFPEQSPARTTFHGLSRRLWCLQHGRGHTWDDRGKTTVRNDYTARRCHTILQQCEVPDWIESAAVGWVFREELQGFSRHYAGADGACVGFALLEMYDGPDEARESFFAHRAADVIPDLDSDDIDGLVDYVFRTYGGGS